MTLDWLSSIYAEFGTAAGDFQADAAAEYHEGEVERFVGVRQILAIEDHFGVDMPRTVPVSVSFSVHDIDAAVLRLFHGKEIPER